MNAEALAFLPLHEVARLLHERRVSAAELTELILDRIERHNTSLNAFITVTADAARADARRADAELTRGDARGPLHGVPISLKDLYATHGVRTTGGSRFLADWVPGFDAAVVERLLAAGAIVVGKNTMHEFALGGTSINPHFGPARNPWNREHIPSGSSGGSAAAVAAGLSFVSMGSETGNSIRRPAAFCGVVGFKPTYGRISRHGMLPAAWSLDHAGPFTRTVRDAALVVDILSAPDRRDPASIDDASPTAIGLDVPVDGLRVGVPRRYLANQLEPAVEAAFETSLDGMRHLGVTVIDVELPAVRFAALVSSIIMGSEAAAYHAERLRDRPDDFGADVRARLELGRAFSAADYLRAQRGRAHIIADLRRTLAQVDLIVAPTAPQVATPIAGGAEALGDRPFEVTEHFFNLHRLFSLAGLPVVSVPMGFGPGGLPAGLQIAGRYLADDLVLRLGHAYERLAAIDRRPPLEA